MSDGIYSVAGSLRLSTRLRGYGLPMIMGCACEGRHSASSPPNEGIHPIPSQILAATIPYILFRLAHNADTEDGKMSYSSDFWFGLAWGIILSFMVYNLSRSVKTAIAKKQISGWAEISVYTLQQALIQAGMPLGTILYLRQPWHDSTVAIVTLFAGGFAGLFLAILLENILDRMKRNRAANIGITQS